MASVDELLIRGFQARQSDRPEQALVCFREALSRAGRDMAIRLEVARTLIDLAQPLDAVDQLKQISVEPTASDDEAELAIELSRLWSRLGRTEVALGLLQKVPPGMHWTQAMLESVLLLERTHRLEQGRAMAQRLAAKRDRHGGDLAANLALAAIDAREGDGVTAIARLERVWRQAPPSELALECGYRLAQLYDSSGQPDTARRIAHQCKQIEREHMPGQLLEKHIQARRTSDREVLDALPEDWFASRPNVAGCPRAVVLGHPRSGTSLLSRRLCHEADAAWIDECPAFSVLARQLTTAADDPSYARFLQRLGTQQIQQFESDYAHRLRQHLPAPELTPARWIDKNPGLSTSLPALHRLLPDSAWVYLVRDPRDVAVSCYFQRFGATPLGWACQTLSGALDAVLHTAALGLRARRLLRPEQAVVVRYEALVTDPGDVVGDMVARLGWPAPAEGAGPQEPAVINSPTYATIRRSVDTRAVGRWLGHAEMFGGLSARQRDLIQELGYPVD